MSSPTRHELFHLQPAHYIFAGVLLTRAIALTRLASSPLLLPLRGDMQFYSDWAQRIVAGHTTNAFAFYGLPGYAWLLAVIYKLFGYAPFVAGLFQCFLDAGTAVLIYKISLRVWSNAGNGIAKLSATLAVIGWAFFVPAQTYAVILMPTAWLVFVFWLTVWFLVRTPQPPSVPSALGFGLLIGLGATGVATILCLLPLVVAAILVKPAAGHDWRRRLTTVAVLLCGVAIGTAPCWVSNYFEARDRVLLSAHSGINFWIGNNPGANGYPHFPPGLRAGQTAMLQDSISVAETAAGHPLKRGEVSRYWSAKAWRFIEERPLSWLRLLALKFRNFWNAFQYDDLSIITILREQGITVPGIYFGIIAALALPAMVLAWNQAQLSRWVTAAILLHLLAILAVFTTERYRLPVVPGLLIFASYGAVTFWQKLAAHNFGPVLSYGSLLVVTTAFIAWPQHDPSLCALDTYNTGIVELELKQYERARENLLSAYAYAPDNAEVNFALGNLSLATGRKQLAKDFYAKTITLDPTHQRAYKNLGVVALSENHCRLAEYCFRRALQQDSREAATHFLLAKSLLGQGDRQAALAEAERAISLSPGQPAFAALRDELR